MDNNPTLFRKSLESWLRRNELDQDSKLYTAEEWQQRNEDLLNDAEFVLVTEGGLHFLLNYNLNHPKVDEFSDFCKSFGFWFDLGHTWSVGFFRLENVDVSVTRLNYALKLKDPRWKQKSALVKARVNNKCEDCDSIKIPLAAHHCWYVYGLEPWQYPLDAFRCLCEECHTSRPMIENDFRGMMARYSQSELKKLLAAINRLFYWYDRNAAFAFLDSIGSNDERFAEDLSNLSKFKTEPSKT